VWDRCDAECSPERGFYYHPSRHSAGQPIVAGWAYQFVAQLTFVRESWTAPVDVERVRPAQGAYEVACRQVKVLLDRLGKAASVPLLVFDAGYDPVKLQQGLEDSPCQILVRLRAGRRFYGDPGLAGPSAATGRPRRHGPKMKCNDPGTWPEPSAEHVSRFVAVVARPAGDGAGPRSHLARLRQALRSGAHLPLPQAEHGMDDASGAPPRAGG
jgi:hypothetical protein